MMITLFLIVRLVAHILYTPLMQSIEKNNVLECLLELNWSRIDAILAIEIPE